MKKMLTILQLMAGANSHAHQSQCNSYALSLNRGFEFYQNECGGFGSKDNCYVETRMASEKEITATVTCFYSGEPDYSDHLKMDISIDLTSCTISKEAIRSCYTD